MNTRKTNLKKLRLPSAGNIQTRNGRRKATTDISNFFTTGTDAGEWGNEVYSDVYSELMPSPIETLKNDDELPVKTRTSPRTKLFNFYPNDNQPAVEIPTTKTKPDDFEAPAKNVKKAPKTKAKSKPRPKKQQKIKSAFLKSEELFSAVTAQHCLVDNVNPDDMQMALALSKSEADISGIVVEEDEAESKYKEEKHVIRKKLQKYGFRVAGSEDYYLTAFMPSKRNVKWANKFTALTLRNPTRQQEKADRKIGEFLSMQLQSNDPPAENVVNYSIRSEVLLPMVAEEGKRIVFWADSYEKENLEDFYVLSLFEPSRTKVGHLLKDIRRIAGRDRSPVKARLCERKHIDTPVDPILQSPATKKSRYSKTQGPESLSVPCIKIDSLQTVQESIVPLPATICALSQRNDNSDSVVGTQKMTASCPAASESISASRRIKSDCATTKVSELNESLMISSPTNASKSLNRSTNTEVLPMDIITPKTPTSSVSFLHTPFSSVRSASPDIFADSDVEMEAGDCSEFKEINVNKSSSSEHQITTYEIYSSDEVKTSFSAAYDHDAEDMKIGVIDLTQYESGSSTQQSEDVVPESFIPTQSSENKCLTDDILATALSLSPKLINTASTDFQLSMETELTFPSNDEKSEIPFRLNGNIQLEKSIESKKASFSFGSCASEEFQRSSFFHTSLSKAEDSVDLTQNSDEELDCIILSDDEVNYSIWKADKEGEEPVKEEPNISIDRDSENKHEFSFIDLVTDTQPDPFVSQESDGLIKTNSNSSLDLLDLDLSKRSDFGILEEQSPFKTPTKTPIKTPKKTPRKTPENTLTKCRRSLSDTFLASPVFSSAPLKRFSSSKKFHEFTTKSDDDSLSDLDDIDKLIYGSPSKKLYKKPAGLEQLLTGPISTEINSSQKSEPESPKEFQFNGRTYLVRTVNISEKPNFETMSESALLDQLYRYGIKPLKRKQAIKILEYVYNQTHPHLVDAETFSSQALVEENNPSDNDMEISEDKNVAVGVSYSKFELKDCWGHNLISEIGTLTEIQDEQYIVQTNTSKKISTALLPFHIAWYNLVKSNKQLHEAILHYEPIDLQEIYLFFKGLGYRYDPKELKYFFDSRSIIFRYDVNKSNPSAGTNRHVRKKRSKQTQPKGKSKTS